MSFYIEHLGRDYADLVSHVRDGGNKVASRGKFHYELPAQQIIVANPEYVSVAETGRGVVPAIGWAEGLQLIAGEAHPQLMTQIAPPFDEYLDGDVFHGSYGPRIRDQIPRVIERLYEDPGSRQAIVTIWDPAYDLQHRRDLPCTLSFQFLIRAGRLHMITTMRSNDVYLGFPYDVFQFTLLQKTIARCLKRPIGRYYHNVGSLHLYESDVERSREIMPRQTMGDYVGGLDVCHDTPSLGLTPMQRWYRVRAATAEALRTMGSSLTVGSDGGWELVEGIMQITSRVNGR